MKKRTIYAAMLLAVGGFCLAPMAQQEYIQSENIDASILPEEILTETVVLDSGAGIFENGATLVYTEGRIRNETDQPSRASSIQHDPETGEYLIYSNGNDVWDNEDATAYLWTTRPGSHRMTVRVRWIQDGGNDWAKAGIMARMDPTNNASPHFFFQFRGAEDGTEVGHRNWELAPTTQTLYQNAAHENTVFLGADAHEPVWVRVTRIWPSNQLIFEDRDQLGTEDDLPWDTPETGFAAFAAPENMNWGIWGFDHQGTSVTVPDAALIDNVLLEPIVGGNRIMSESHFAPGEPVDVTILLNNPGDPADAEVVETVPEGWAVSNVSGGGSESGGTITWSLSGVSGDQEVSYTVTPPADAVSGAFDGAVNGIMTAGPQIVGAMPDAGAALGDFDGVSAIGGAEGEASFADGAYTMTASGNANDTADIMQFVWKRVSGDFSIQAHVDPFGTGRAGLMVRDSLADSSSFMFIGMDSALAVYMRTRDLAGMNAYDQRGATWYPGIAQRNGTSYPGDLIDQVLRMERAGDQVVLSFGDLGRPDDETMTVYGAGTFIGTDPVYVGIAAYSGADTPDAEVTVTELELVGDDTPVENWSVF